MTVHPVIRHPEWIERTSGGIRYSRDMQPEGALVGRLIRCPYPAARILSIDFADAAALPGVAAILTAVDMPDRRYKDYGQSDRPAMARDRAVYCGHEVVALAAETAELADRAAAMIRVRYKRIGSATDTAAALRAGAPVVHPDRGPDNIASTTDRTFGDVETARRRAAHVVTGDYLTGIQAHACMEPHVAVASWDAAAQVMNVWTPTQSPRNVRAEIAWLLDLEPGQVRLHRVAVGGDFGARVKASDIEVLAAALSRKAGRPVTIGLTRADEFAYTKRQHECRIRVSTGVDAEGLVTHHDADLTVENGAYIHGGSNMMSYCSILMAAQYRLQGAIIRGRSVYTNRRPGGAFRGAGGPQAAFAIECQMDEVARTLGIDPIDLRLRNLNQTGDRTITGWEMRSVRAAECLEAVRKALDWDEARRNGGSGRGVGIALAMHVSGAIVSPPTGRAEVSLEIGHNGGVVLSSGCADSGTGEYAVIAQICARELGLRADQVELRVMDTAVTPYDPGAGSSRATLVTGGAVRAVSRKVAEALKDVAADRLGCLPDDVALGDGDAVGPGGRRMPLGALAAAHPQSSGGTLRIELEEVVDNPVVSMAAGDAGYGNLSPAYAFAAHGVEVEVDRRTGGVRVLRVVAAHDAGVVINPVGARGQVIGGVAMGLGAALGEELLYEDGRPLVTSYLDYALPRATEVPPVEVIFVGDQESDGRYASKSIAEVALMPTAAAVANAVAHATGARISSLPISPDKILAALPGPRAADAVPPVSGRPGRWWPALVRGIYPLGLHTALHRGGPGAARAPAPAATPKTVLSPRRSDEAVADLAADPAARPAGGATDILSMRDQGFPAPATLVGLRGCADMRGIEEADGGDLVIGAATTLADALRALERASLPGDRAVRATLEAIASPQIREQGTVGGNLCQDKRCWFYRSGFDCYKRGGFWRPCYAVLGDNRYHHAVVDGERCQAVTPSDLATTLTALDAVVEARSAAGARTIPIGDFYSGPGETVLSPAEILHSIRIPATARARAAHFEKFSRTSDGFAIVSAAVSLDLAGGTVTACRAVLGGVAARPYRSIRTEEAMLRGGRSVVADAARAWLHDAHPLEGNAWKLDAACAVLERSLIAGLDAAPDGAQRRAAGPS